MSITPTVLRAKKKHELKEIASDLGLNTKGLRSELEERIRIHLESEDATSSKTSPRRSFRKKSTSSSKSKSRKDIPSPPNGDRPSSDEEPGSSESEGKQVIERTTILEETTQYITNQLTLESSQQDVAVNTSFNRAQNTEINNDTIQRGLTNDDRLRKINDFLDQLRNNVSNSRTFCKTIIYLELAVFLYNAIDWPHKIASFTAPSLLGSEAHTYVLRAPDIFVLIEWHGFWRPLVSFIFYLMLLPLGFSYIFNFEPTRFLYSPLTFSVAQYAIFMVSLPFFDWAEDVREYISENLIYVGAGTGAFFALYEGILENQ